MSHSISAVIDAAIPKVSSWDITYNTPRSGLAVELEPVKISKKETQGYLASVVVKIDGKVDYADAFQLADFFNALSERLKEVA